MLILLVILPVFAGFLIWFTTKGPKSYSFKLFRHSDGELVEMEMDFDNLADAEKNLKQHGQLIYLKRNRDKLKSRVGDFGVLIGLVFIAAPIGIFAAGGVYWGVISTICCVAYFTLMNFVNRN